jgi:hypothetical protein
MTEGNKWTGYNALYAVQREKEHAARDIKPPGDIKAPGDITPPERVQIASVDIKAPHDIKTPDDIKSLDAGQWTAMPNAISDKIMPTLELSDQAVLNRLYRLTWGFHRETCKVSKDALSKACNIHPRQVPRSTQRLAARGLIEIVGHDMDNPNKLERGTIYRMLLPRATVGIKSSGVIKARGDIKAPGAHVSPIKMNTQKENTQTQDAPAAGVRVGSKFTIEECRRYADHLRSTGQGINNPGGYATTIHRTGEADELIERFLSPTPSPAQADTSSCPDCQGTGFYYPKGIDQGVAKCPHSRLTT